MPLAQSDSKDAFTSNLKAEITAGKPQKQALAIAYSVQRRNHHAAGGGIGGFHLMPTPHAAAGHPQMTTSSQGSPWWTRAASREMDASPVHLKFADGGIGHYAAGGMMPASQASPWTERADARLMDQPFHSGLIPGATGGRTDRLPLQLGSDSHIIPADAVSGLGQGGTQNGAAAWAAAIRGGPWGVPIPHVVHGHGPPAAPHPLTGATELADGGQVHPKTSILAASEELCVPPEDVWALGARGVRHGLRQKGEGPMDVGHRLIDEAIHNVRQFVIDWTKRAPRPKKSEGGSVVVSTGGIGSASLAA